MASNLGYMMGAYQNESLLAQQRTIFFCACKTGAFVHILTGRGTEQWYYEGLEALSDRRRFLLRWRGVSAVRVVGEDRRGSGEGERDQLTVDSPPAASRIYRASLRDSGPSAACGELHVARRAGGVCLNRFRLLYARGARIDAGSGLTSSAGATSTPASAIFTVCILPSTFWSSHFAAR